MSPKFVRSAKPALAGLMLFVTSPGESPSPRPNATAPTRVSESADLPENGPHDLPALRLRAWAWLKEGALRELEAHLAVDTPSDELLFLRGTGRLHLGRWADGVSDLRELWWQRTTGVWALAALRELARCVPAGARLYSRAERALLLSTLPEASPEQSAEAGADDNLLGALLSRAPRKGRLATELHYARGVRLIRAEHFTEAVRELGTALRLASEPGFRRAVALRLGEAYRRRGDFDAALRCFEQVLRTGGDALALDALSQAGQIDVENQRYPEARARFEARLIENPVGPNREQALWGLGWVAFRTGSFVDARRFFRALAAEAPDGALATSALYWAARSLEEQGAAAQGSEELAALLARFPLDYYAYRARERLGPRALAASAIEVPTELTHSYPRALVELLSAESARERVASELVVAVAKQESAFDPNAVSPVGALGLMQLLPRTAALLVDEERRHHQASRAEILRPQVNVRLGVRYLARMLHGFSGRVEYALAAYNAGPGAVTRWREARGDLPAEIFVEEIPYPETRQYVRRVLANAQAYRLLSRPLPARLPAG